MTDRSFCVGCDRLDMCSLEPLSRHCALKSKMKAQQPQTNEDNIKAMSTEELATWIWNVQLGLARTMDDILDWLQSPADGSGGE